MRTVRDAHTHFFSRTFFDTLYAQAPPDRRPPSLEAAVAGAGLALPDPDPAVLQLHWLEQMDRAGIETMVTFASVPEEAAVVAEAAADSSGRLVGYTVVNAASPKAADMVENALGKLGLRGIVLFPALHGYSPSDEACRPAFEAVSAHRGVVVVHCGAFKVKLRDLLGLPRTYDGRYASPLGVVRAASAHPDVPFVLPHFGGGLFAETLLVGSWCPNVHVDTSSSNDWMRAQPIPLALRDVLARALDVFGAERVLFGTDSSTFPRGYRKDLLEAQLAALAELGTSEEDTERVLGGNLERLLGA
jgi:predicted TIM-barrel fold metal-dependent hydrolase